PLVGLLLLALLGFALSLIGLGLLSLVDLRRPLVGLLLSALLGFALSLIGLGLLSLVDLRRPLVGLRGPLRVRIVLLEFLSLLDLLLLDSLALLVLFQAQILELLLLLLLEPRVGVARIVWSRRRRPVVVHPGIALICRAVALNRGTIAGAVRLSRLLRLSALGGRVGWAIRVPRLRIWGFIVRRIRGARISRCRPSHMYLGHVRPML